MNSPPAQVGFGGKAADGQPLFWAFLALAVCLLAITSQSLWIDEALTATKAASPSLRDWWQAMFAGKESDLQMPLYMIYIWGFAKLFGSGEWALRAANIPWFLGGFTVFITSLRQTKKGVLATVILASPFAWYYLDEARPYAMQLGASLLIFAALLRMRGKETTPARDARRWVLIFFLGIIALSGSSLLGMIWAGAACACVPFVVSWKRLGELARTNKFVSVLSTTALLALGLYYIWTLKLGARASDVGTTDARNVIFIGYELLGFSGLGPGRLDIRGGGLRAFMPFVIPLAVYALVILDLMVRGISQWYRGSSGKNFVLAVLVVLAAMAVIIATGFVAHFRVLGRHFMPLLPVILFILGLGLSLRWSQPGLISKLIVCAFAILGVTSCLSLRFAARHAKDDYRAAARAASTALARSQTVWWNAAEDGAGYYHLPLTAGQEANTKARLILNPTPEALSALPAPDVVIASKPDIYDNQAALGKYLRDNTYVKTASFAAFTVWERKAAAIHH